MRIMSPRTVTGVILTLLIGAADLGLALPVVAAPDAMAERRVHPRIGVTGTEAGRVVIDLEPYLAKVTAAGGVPVVLGYGAAVTPEDLDGILFTGGEDVDPALYHEDAHGTVEGNPARDRSELAQAKAALAAGLPILGICRGSQLLNVQLGGSLIQDIPSQIYQAVSHKPGSLHAVTVATGTRLAGLLGRGTLTVNSYHHQAVKRLATGLRRAAESPDGVVEAWEAQPGGPITGYVTGVQFHPEEADFPDATVSRRIFADFIRAAADYATKPAVTRK